MKPARTSLPSDMPFTIWVLCNWKESLDAVIQKDRDLYFDDAVAVSSVFIKKGFLYLGDITLTSGQARLEVSLSDVQGNEKSDAYTIQVVR